MDGDIMVSDRLQQRRKQKPSRGQTSRPPREQYRYRRPERAADFLPDPEVLEAYNYVIEGSADKIIDMIEKEQIHRHELENRALSNQTAGLFFGQVLAALIALSLVVSVTVLGLNGLGELAAFIGFIGMCAMTMAFVSGRKAVLSRYQP